jgi:hypothetical protein
VKEEVDQKLQNKCVEEDAHLKCIWRSYLETHRPRREPMSGFAHLAQTSAGHKLALPSESID